MAEEKNDTAATENQKVYKANIDPWFLENHTFGIKKPMMPVVAENNGKKFKKGRNDES